jgi:hypothetical protein
MPAKNINIIESYMRRKFSNIIINGDCALVELTQNNYAKIDIIDIDNIKDIVWYINSGGYAQGFDKLLKKPIKMHKRIINSENMFIDHINHDKLDNRRCNLRICTNQQNMRNSKISIRNTSGVKGVYFNKHAKKYISIITLNSKNYHLGCFDSIEDAKKIRIAAGKSNNYANIQ